MSGILEAKKIAGRNSKCLLEHTGLEGLLLEKKQIQNVDGGIK